MNIMHYPTSHNHIVHSNKRDLDAKVGRSFNHHVDNKTGDITITYTEAIDTLKNTPEYSTHQFVFPAKVIMEYLDRHVLSVYEQASRERAFQDVIDSVFAPLRKSSALIIQKSGSTETIEYVYETLSLNGATVFRFDRSGDAFAVDTGSGIVSAAWAAALLAAFRNVGYDEFYGSIYDIQRKMLHRLEAI